MKLVITVDTEEDNWGDYRSTSCTLENITRIPALQRIFDDFDAKPTYLITYPVATDQTADAILGELLEAGKCEIGTHCHPWNTPPLEEAKSKVNTMLCNLPEDLQRRKISVLHDAIQRRFNWCPVSFRSGRWGYSQAVARNLCRIGYKIDSSITPYTDWTDQHGPDFSDISPRAFRFSGETVLQESRNGGLVEVPPTIGYVGCLSRNARVIGATHKLATGELARRVRLMGILSRLMLAKKVWLSPETADVVDMMKLTRRNLSDGYGFVNMVFHSSSLKHGLNPFVQTKEDEGRFLEKIRMFLSFTREAGIESVRLSDSLRMPW